MKKGVMVTKLYEGVFKLMSNDSILLSLMGVDELQPEEDLLLEKVLKFQKRRKPQISTLDFLPIISYYTPGGTYDTDNDHVYYAGMVFDIYTNDDVNRAHLINDRLCEIFDGEIPVMDSLATLEILHEEGYESNTELSDTYCFTVIFTFGIALNV